MYNHQVNYKKYYEQKYQLSFFDGNNLSKTRLKNILTNSCGFIDSFQNNNCCFLIKLKIIYVCSLIIISNKVVVEENLAYIFIYPAGRPVYLCKMIQNRNVFFSFKIDVSNSKHRMHETFKKEIMCGDKHLRVIFLLNIV